MESELASGTISDLTYWRRKERREERRTERRTGLTPLVSIKKLVSSGVDPLVFEKKLISSGVV